MIVLVGLLAVGLLAVGCRGEPRAPAIGVPYRPTETAFHAFLESEIERLRPPGAPRLRLVTGASDSARVPADDPVLRELARAERIARDPDVVVVVGPGGSREILQSAPTYAAQGIPQVVPTGTSRLLETVEPRLILLAPNDSLQGELLGTFAVRALEARRAER